MAIIRKAIQEELARRGWSAYRLVKELRGKRPDGCDVTPTVVYEFLRGETATMNMADLELILVALELELRPRRRV